MDKGRGGREKGNEKENHEKYVRKNRKGSVMENKDRNEWGGRVKDVKRERR